MPKDLLLAAKGMWAGLDSEIPREKSVVLSFSGGALVSGVPRARPVSGASDLPSTVDVVVIGGGIIGCVTALNLAERKVSVAVCEKGVIAGEASGRAAGLIEYQHLAPAKMELIARSIDLWRGMAQRVDGDIGYVGRGLVTLYDDDAAADAAASWLETVIGKPGVDARMVSGREVKQIDPDFGSGWRAALLQVNGAALEPRLAAPAIAEAAMRKGATVLQHCAVRGIECQAGRIASVVTERGAIRTNNVVIAAGVWSPMLARQVGLSLPQLMVFAEMLSVEPLSGGPVIPGMTPAGYFRREPDGGYMIGTSTGAIPVTPTLLRHLPRLMSTGADIDQQLTLAFNLRTFRWEAGASDKWSPDRPSRFERNRIFQPELVGKTSAQAYAGMRRYIPAFRNSNVRERYTGALMTSIDNLGVISSVKRIPGLYLGTGMLYGLTLAAAAGEALADLITGERPKFDVSPYCYERFEDGSKLVFHA